MITNFKNLARNPLRKKALLIAEAGYAAIDIEKVIGKEIKIDGQILTIKAHKIDLDRFKRIFLIGIGKGSALACVFLTRILDKKLTKGVALDIQKPKLKIRNSKLEILTGTHPLPSKQNITATKKIIDLAKGASKNDLLITFICGGGSALLCSSETELNASRTIFKELTKKGADIIELNTVRKHLSEIKGGNLAKIAYPATIISLIISDVIGNDLSMVASGPTVFDKTTIKDAIRILDKFKISHSKFQLIETPKDKKYVQKVKNILFLSNREPILAMEQKAKQLAFKTKIYSLNLKSEAKKTLFPLIKLARKNGAMLAAGETTVKLGNKPIGKGGRNTEAVLGAIKTLINDAVILSLASDGRDNTEAAGAIADYLTIERIEKLKLNTQKFLNNHDSFTLFQKTGDLIFTEPKTFNVSDLMLIFKL